MKTRSLILQNVMLILLFTASVQSISPAFAQGGDDGSVNVSLTNGQGAPLNGVKVGLFLYQLSGSEATPIQMGYCRTGKDGRCQIPIADAPRDQGGFLRGYLEIGDYGRRSLLWPGGVLEMSVWLDQASSGLDIAGEEPYDWQKQGADDALEVTIAPETPKLRVEGILAIAGTIIVWLGIIYWRTKR